MKQAHKINTLLLVSLIFIEGRAQVSDPTVDRTNKRLIFDSQEHLKAFITPFAWGWDSTVHI